MKIVDILEDNDIIIKMKNAGKKLNRLWGDTEKRTMYTVEIKNKSGETYKFDYWCIREDKEYVPSVDDVINSLYICDPGTLEEYVASTGIEKNIRNWTDVARAQAWYKEDVKQYVGIYKILGSDILKQIKQLREII